MTGLVEYTVGSIKNPEFMKGWGGPGAEAVLAEGPGGRGGHRVSFKAQVLQVTRGVGRLSA